MNPNINGDLDRLKLCLDGATDGIYMFDANTFKFFYVNRTGLEQTGYSMEEMMSMTPMQVRPDPSEAKFREFLEALISGENHFRKFDTAIRRKDGAYLPIEIGVQYIAGSTKQDSYFISITRDITERKQIEAQLRIAATAFESHESLMITDSFGTILRVNQAFTKTTGYTIDEAVGQTPAILKSGRHEAAFYREMWNAIAQTGKWQGEIWNRRKNGEIFPVLLVISAVKDSDGIITNFVGLQIDISERKQAEKRLEQLNAELSATLLAIPDLLFEFTEEGKYINIWAGQPELLVTQREMMLGRMVSEILPPVAVETVMASIQDASVNGQSFGKIISLDLPKSTRWFELSTSAKITQGQEHRYMMLARDITDRINAEQALKLNEQRYRTMIEATGALTWCSPPTGLNAGPQLQWMAFTGQTAEEMLGTGWTKAIHPDDLANTGIQWQKAVETLKPYFCEYRLRRHDGVWRWTKAYGVPIFNDNGEVVEWFGMNLDIQDSKEAEEKIEHMAYHDQLTGLPNRSLFLDRLTQVLSIARRAHRYGAIIFMDLDQFKKQNDVYGHEFGDKVLMDVAKRIREYIRQGDTVARFGGDEFVILLPELSTDQTTAASQALSVGEKLRTELKVQGNIEGRNYSTSVSLGISLFPRQDETVEDLIREADIAMYRAKIGGRNHLVFYEDKMQQTISERFVMEQELSEAIVQNQLELFLQSKMDLTGNVVGAETLVRWRHPVKGLVLPSEFISMAEETDLVVRIGEWVLRESCLLIAHMQTMRHGLNLSVNFSPRQFHHADLVGLLNRILAETGADPQYLTLEITENLLIEKMAEVVSRMNQLSEMGVRFSIDDFGTGYSSLSYLKRLPLREIKIDRSFVQDIPHDLNDVALVETILSIAHHFNFEVVAEGVETEEQFKFLSERQCDQFQGYFFHRPEHKETWLARVERTQIEQIENIHQIY